MSKIRKLCCNCGGLGAVGISIDCPNCTTTKELALFLAAPNLLIACKKLISATKRDGANLEPAIKAAKKAIAEAEGKA